MSVLTNEVAAAHLALHSRELFRVRSRSIMDGTERAVRMLAEECGAIPTGTDAPPAQDEQPRDWYTEWLEHC